MTALVFVALGVAVTLAAMHLARSLPEILRRRRRPERVEECTCGAQLRVSRAHLVAATYDEADMGGSTAVVAAFCRTHCPGGCNHLKEHR